MRAEVLSLGDTRNYLLATTKNELGVVFAESVAGVWESTGCCFMLLTHTRVGTPVCDWHWHVPYMLFISEICWGWPVLHMPCKSEIYL